MCGLHLLRDESLTSPSFETVPLASNAVRALVYPSQY